MKKDKRKKKNKVNKLIIFTIQVLAIFTIILFSYNLGHIMGSIEAYFSTDYYILQQDYYFYNNYSLYDITKILREEADNFCVTKSARYGYYSLYSAGNYVGCYFYNDTWQEYTGKEYTEWVENNIFKQNG